MLTVRRVTGVALAVALGLGAGGCLAGPSDWLYSVGVAKIGDTYHVVAPLCDDERLDSIEVYDNLARRNASPGTEATAAIYWRAEGPVAAEAQRGTVVLGDDKAFGRVPVEPGAQAPFPAKVMGITIGLTWQGGKKKTGEAFGLDEVPSYPAGSDPATVKYRIDDDHNKRMLLTAEEIHKKMKRCARETV